MKRVLLGVVAAAMATGATAQALAVTPTVTEGDAFKGQIEAMRTLWKRQPGKPIRMTIPLYGRVMQLDMPVGFLPAYKVEGGAQFLFEFTQGGETVENWTRLITIRSIAGAGTSTLAMDNATLAERLFYPAKCVAGPLYKVLDAKDLGGGLSAMTVANGCGNTPAGAYALAREGSGEQNFTRLFRDGSSLYMVGMAIRGASFAAGKAPLADAEGRKIIAEFGDVRVCAEADTDETCRTALGIEKMRAGK